VTYCAVLVAFGVVAAGLIFRRPMTLMLAVVVVVIVGAGAVAVRRSRRRSRPSWEIVECIEDQRDRAYRCAEVGNNHRERRKHREAVNIATKAAKPSRRSESPLSEAAQPTVPA
jgi:hypothetical protein